MKIIAYSTAAFLALGGAALADGHSARELAGGMSGALAGGAALGGAGTEKSPNNGGNTNNGKGTASNVSGGNPEDGGNGGWGNIGSQLTGGQVSNRGGGRGTTLD